MKLWKKFLVTMLTTAMCMPMAAGMTARAETRTRDVVIDGDKAITTESKLYRGAGMVTGNNSSRLLLDYKAENPEAYWEIMNYMFGKKGIGLCHIKIEMGSDINSSSGTEPNIMRTEDEKPDVTRGAGYQLAADALTINPDITLDMLYWSEPRWVTDAADVYAARYKWYKAHLDAAYETYGLKFQYVSAVRNEREIDCEWVKYLSKALKAETDCPYDYSAIKVVAADEVTGWAMADYMLKDEELLNAVDVIGSHYTSWSSANAQMLSEEYGKELWFSEASTPMVYSKGTYRFDGTGSGLNDLNGVLDIANRYITMFPGGCMTMCEYQPVVSAYYDGVTYCHKQMITANSPWDGSYLLDGGYYMSLHFSQFIDKGWTFIEDASYGDGVKGGDGHAIVDAVYSYMTVSSPDTDDYTTVLTNTTAEPIVYNFTVKNLDKAGAPVYVWETRSFDGGDWRENYFRNIDTISPTENGGEYTYSISVKPYSLVTLSTVERNQADYEYEDKAFAALELPYSDDFEYSGYPADYLASRGNAPRYTTDQGGAFEVENINGNNVLVQKITPATKADEWGGTPDPTTNFGDDRWFNYSISADVGFAPADDKNSNYAGLGLRYNLACNGQSGYWLKLFESGKWQLMRNNTVRHEGTITAFDSTKMSNIRLEAVDNTVKAYVDDVLICDYNGTDLMDAMLSGGRAALYSSYNQNMFDNVSISPIEGTATYVYRYDNTDLEFDYEGTWDHRTIDSYKNYKRTISRAKGDASMTFTFTGTGFSLTGIGKDCNFSVELDGAVYDDLVYIASSKQRESMYAVYGLENTEHTVKINIIDGAFGVDGAEIIGVTVPTVQQPVHSEAAAVTSEAVTSTADSVGTAESGTAENTENKGSAALPLAIGGAVAAAAGIAAGVVISRKKKK